MMVTLESKDLHPRAHGVVLNDTMYIGGVSYPLNDLVELQL